MFSNYFPQKGILYSHVAIWHYLQTQRTNDFFVNHVKQ